MFDAPARSIDEMAREATHGLRERAPQFSAAEVLSNAQKKAAVLFLAATAAALLIAPLTAVLCLNVFIAAYFVCAISFRLLLVSLGARTPISKGPPSRAPDDDLPVITILLPLYRDAEALASLTRAVDGLDYPAAKKDVKLLIEEDDPETLEEARRLQLGERFEIVVVPEGRPRTKPKACNIGLQLARGELCVIYDAEDQPEPDQLIKAAHAFGRADPALACLQARLNFYNADENWLTRLFTLEYSLWFDWLLPGLQRLGAPIPLGGTSNFFRTKTLIEVGGWDPFNVTEDADLGLRLARLGHRVALLDSTTFEEANCRLGNWVRQRSRWMKGYMQTWAVHMRDAPAFVRATGWTGFLAVQLFVAGNVASALISPILWSVSLIWLLTGSAAISAAFPEPLMTINMLALTFGNAFFILLAAIAPLKRGWAYLSVYALTAPFYWLLTSVGAYKALVQIVRRPHYWEKTDHVISAIAARKRKEALAEIFAP